MTDFRFKYRSEREAADQVLDDILEVLAEFSVEERLVRALSLTVSEAFTNAVIHGNREDADKTILVTLQVMEEQIVADIVDEGTGGLKRIQTKEPSSELDEAGRGIDLIRHYADASSFTETVHGGLKVSIVFRRTRQTMTSNSS